MDVAGEQVARRQRQQQHQQIDGESAENGGGAFIPRAALQPGVVPPTAHALVQRRDQPPDQVEQRKGDRHRQQKVAQRAEKAGGIENALRAGIDQLLQRAELLVKGAEAFLCQRVQAVAQRRRR